MEREFPDVVSESNVLNLVKDIGIGATTLIILGRLMVKLVQVAIEFFHGLRLNLVDMWQAILDGLEQLIRGRASSDWGADRREDVAPTSPHTSL